MTISSVVVPFDGAGSKPSIQIIPETIISTFDPAEFGAPLRVYPPNCTFHVTRGEIVKKGIKQVEVPGDMISWSGRSGSLKFAPDTVPSITFLFGFDKEGVPISGSTVNFTVDMNKATIKSNLEFQGLVKVGNYKASYERIIYKPESTVLGPFGYEGIHTNFGVIAAYKDGSLKTYEVPVTSIAVGPEQFELYRVVSSILVNLDGQWEKPPNWDGDYNNLYPDNRPGPEKGTAVEIERIHEIGYVTKYGGQCWYETFPKNLIQPYENEAFVIRDKFTAAFQPVIRLKAGNPETLFPPEQAWERSAAIEALAKRKKLPLIR